MLFNDEDGRLSFNLNKIYFREHLVREREKRKLCAIRKWSWFFAGICGWHLSHFSARAIYV